MKKQTPLGNNPHFVEYATTLTALLSQVFNSKNFGNRKIIKEAVRPSGVVSKKQG